MANPYRNKRTGRFSTQFATTSGFDPVNADGPDVDSIADLDTTGIGDAFPVREPVTGPTYNEHYGRSTRQNIHARRAVAIDATTGQKLFDLDNDELVRIARQKMTDAAGDSEVIRQLVDLPTHVTEF